MALKSDFLIELGVEEIPSNLLEPISRQFKENFRTALIEAGVNLDKGDIEAAATSRRLVLFGRLNRESEAKEVVIQGPSEKIAYKEDNSPSEATIGFTKSMGVSLGDIFIESTDRGRYIFAKRKDKACKTESIIAKILLDVIAGISLPRYMKWDSFKLKFSRPIRSILIIFAGTVIREDFGGIRSSDFTLVREGAEIKRLRVKSKEDYLKELKRRKIALSFKERKEKIEALLEREAVKAGLKLQPQPELLDEVTNLVESPVVIRCGFNREYLKLPDLVLLASMAKYQRVFALTDKGSKLTNQFLAVLDSNPGDKKSVKRHYEFVLDARLKDAVLFYNEDIKSPLESKAAGLSGIVLHDKLGTMLDKRERLKLMAKEVSKLLDLDSKKSADFIRALELFKVDLLTKMVYEFPSLEGLIGGIYAEYQGENKSVASAISEHYRPRSNDDALPATELGALLSLLDKLYNVVGILGIGVVPSGSADPFTIRRQVQSIVRILIQYQLEISLENLFSLAFLLFKDSLSQDYESTKERFLAISKERFSVLMHDNGIASDLVGAVVISNFKLPSEVYLRLSQLLNISKRDEFYKAIKVAERTERIVADKRESGSLELKEGLLEQPEERELYNIYLKVKDKIKDKIDNREYDKATLLYAGSFYDIIDRFFQEVLVNAKRQDLRENRKLLLFEINRLLTERVLNPKEMEVLKDAKSV